MTIEVFIPMMKMLVLATISLIGFAIAAFLIIFVIIAGIELMDKANAWMKDVFNSN